MGYEGGIRPTGHRGLPGRTGKRTRVVGVEREVPLTTQTEYHKSAAVLGCNKASSKDEETPSIARCTLGSEEGALPPSVAVIPDTNMYLAKAQSIIVDLYGMESEDEQRNSQPFLHTIELHGPQGEIVRIKSTFDDGAMVNAVDLSVYQKSEHCLKPLDKSNRILRMADGRLVPSAGIWNGEVTIGNITRGDTFEVFDSKGAWLALFGKPLLKKFKAIHDYDTDIVKIPKDGDWVVLRNQYPCEKRTETTLLTSQDLNINQRTNFKGDHCAPPSRQVSHDGNDSEPVDVAGSETAPLPPLGQDPDTEKRTNLKGDHCAPPSRQVFQSNKSTNELVDKAVIEQAEQGNYPPDSRGQEEENSESLNPASAYPGRKQEMHTGRTHQVARS